MTSDSQVTVHEAQLTFHIKTWEGEGLVFMLLALEVHARKTYFVSKYYMAYCSCYSTFPNFACISSYFDLGSFAWKREWTISPKLHQLRLWKRNYSTCFNNWGQLKNAQFFRRNLNFMLLQTAIKRLWFHR